MRSTSTRSTLSGACERSPDAERSGHPTSRHGGGASCFAWPSGRIGLDSPTTQPPNRSEGSRMSDRPGLSIFDDEPSSTGETSTDDTRHARRRPRQRHPSSPAQPAGPAAPARRPRRPSFPLVRKGGYDPASVDRQLHVARRREGRPGRQPGRGQGSELSRPGAAAVRGPADAVGELQPDVRRARWPRQRDAAPGRGAGRRRARPGPRPGRRDHPPSQHRRRRAARPGRRATPRTCAWSSSRSSTSSRTTAMGDIERDQVDRRGRVRRPAGLRQARGRPAPARRRAGGQHAPHRRQARGRAGQGAGRPRGAGGPAGARRGEGAADPRGGRAPHQRHR